MNTQFIDTKIKSLIQICKDTKNYRKLTIVGYALISNILDETGIKLGLRPRDKGLGEISVPKNETFVPQCPLI